MSEYSDNLEGANMDLGTISIIFASNSCGLDFFLSLLLGRGGEAADDDGMRG